MRDDAGTLLDFHWKALNPAAEALVGGLGLERALSSWGGVVEELPERAVLRQVVEGGAPLSFMVHCRSGGEERWYRARAAKQGDGFSLWLFDETEAWRERRSLREELERERAEGERVVERMQEEARFRECFIGILGHDLRNPLNAVKLSARALRRRGGLAPEQQQLAHRIEACAARMGDMISDILDLTRVRLSEGIPLQLEPTSLPTVCRQVLEELSVAHPGRPISFEEHGQGEGLWDSDRLAQVVSNLVGNALEHGAKGAPIVVRCVGEPERQVLEVSNQGEPIPNHLLDTLFDPFRQGSSAQGGRGGGLGLGLFIVRELVQAHGGQVSVRSTEKEGTTFTVVLPREARESAHSA